MVMGCRHQPREAPPKVTAIQAISLMVATLLRSRLSAHSAVAEPGAPSPGGPSSWPASWGERALMPEPSPARRWRRAPRRGGSRSAGGAAPGPRPRGRSGGSRTPRPGGRGERNLAELSCTGPASQAAPPWARGGLQHRPRAAPRPAGWAGRGSAPRRPDGRLRRPRGCTGCSCPCRHLAQRGRGELAGGLARQAVHHHDAPAARTPGPAARAAPPRSAPA